ncbi:MAG TPA: ABC transporter ATP-binding protein [Candidatus Dormibacteraeota bacterium]|nr:ABC transporter ATP-binding protein [Candidatus Dormibacteraeota bacterium]
MDHHNESAVTFGSVVKRYGDVVALDNLSFTIARGETVALLGPNGAGKSTAVDLLLGLRAPDEGRVAVLGGEPARAVAAGRVGGMLQTGALPQGARVRELLELARALYGSRRSVADLLDLADLGDLVNRPASHLSGGQTQRVRFALALAGRPELLFLDEPTVAMDVESRHRFWAIVRAVAADGTGILFATHYLEEADRTADRILLIDRGRLVREGTPAAIRATQGARTVRCTLAEPDRNRLAALPGVREVTIHGHDVTLTTTDADALVGALYALGKPVRDIQVSAAALEDAFLQLTAAANS